MNELISEAMDVSNLALMYAGEYSLRLVSECIFWTMISLTSPIQLSELKDGHRNTEERGKQDPLQITGEI